MAYPRSCLMLLLLTAYLCSMALHATALSFSYDFSKPGDLDRANLVYINDSSNSGDRVSLTEMTTWSTGRVAYPQPVRLWDDRTGKRASFTTNFSFAINGNTTNGNRRGDGMAFFVGPFPASLPPDSRGGFLGLFTNYSDDNHPSPQTVGVEFDTCSNPGLDPPDVTADHIGIDINSISSRSYTKLPNMALSGTMSASITYDGRSKVMSVSLVRVGEEGPAYSVKARVDLRDDAGVPSDAAVGFSAATGALVESHQLISWSFTSTDPSKINLWVIILIAVAGASLTGFLAALVYILIHKRSPVEISLPVARKFSYHRLSVATDDFSEDRKLGSGSFGAVYRGDLRDRRFVAPVAVKKLTLLLEQTRRDYANEIMILGQLRHHNLVKLVGWCDGGGDDKKLLLVYELVTNGSLDKHLHGSPERILPWPERYKIAIGVGSAIEYLHTGDEDAILHRDIKPSNVMLDGDFVAKLGDFGLVRQVKPGHSSLGGTAMVGSYDYMDPKCITTGTATTASDMYSFGVLLLEIATGMRPRVLRDVEEVGRGGGRLASPLVGLPNALIDAVRGAYGKGAVLEMADARLNGDFDGCQMERVLLVGLLCVQKDRRDRLGIREAVNLLSNPKHPLPEVITSIYDDRKL
ncbi:unnamed protein product [Urochloa decumbens]|uniref:non-specific serine/threonine protein kinase n=1 Tax=Urochloa decumbens TaxID=240449 RepID=A0ABC8YNW8_9POAL